MSPSPHRSPPSPAAVQALARVSVAAGDLVRAERSRRKLTLRELAARAGVSATVIAHIEAGHPASLETYARLATALELRLELGLVDPRRRTGPSREADLVHAAMGDAEAALRLDLERVHATARAAAQSGDFDAFMAVYEPAKGLALTRIITDTFVSKF